MRQRDSASAHQRLADLRLGLLNQHRLDLVKVFDTLEKEQGAKDVCLGRRADGQLAILRIGEQRPAWFSPNGYEGEHLIVPAVLDQDRVDGTPYELEAYVAGQMASAVDGSAERNGQLREEMLTALLDAFWEFQAVGKSLPLQPKFSLEKVMGHFGPARPLLRRPNDVLAAVECHRQFWSGQHPSKWKFADDNLIITPAGKVAFIDNVNVGARFLGYDLGWLIWPRWVEMRTELYSDVDRQWQYLEHFQELALGRMPNGFVATDDFREAFWLTALERLVGAVYDIAVGTKHLAGHQLGPRGDPARTAAYVSFLNGLIDQALALPGILR